MSNVNLKCVWSLASLAGLVLAAGCASEPAKPAPPPATQQREPAAPPPAPNAEFKLVLPPGAAQPPAPFEGTGWQTLFDGQSLTGWRVTPFAGRGEVHCQD